MRHLAHIVRPLSRMPRTGPRHLAPLRRLARILPSLSMALALVGPFPPDAVAAPKKVDLPLLHERLGRFWMLLAPLEGELAVGAASAWENRPDGGALLEGELDFEPQLRWRRGRFRLKLPLSIAHRQTVGFDLPETRLEGGLALSWRAAESLTLEASARVARIARPGWPDLYQPILDDTSTPTGALAPTDRYSEVTPRARLAVEWKESESLSLNLRASWDGLVQDKDPAFDAVLAPTHLTPLDRDHWRLALGVETEPILRRLHADLELSLEGFDSAYQFARDAGTGATHANVGGLPGNPLQSLLRITVAPSASLWLPALGTRLYLDLHYARTEDDFADYYTSDAWGGRVRVKVKPQDALALELGYSLDHRAYTDRGYQPSASHAPLDHSDDGAATRTRHTQGLHAEAALRLADDQLEPFLAWDWTRVDDTMPDYVPWQNPPTSPYAIDFDQEWHVVRLGLRAKL